VPRFGESYFERDHGLWSLQSPPICTLVEQLLSGRVLRGVRSAHRPVLLFSDCSRCLRILPSVKAKAIAHLPVSWVRTEYCAVVISCSLRSGDFVPPFPRPLPCVRVVAKGVPVCSLDAALTAPSALTHTGVDAAFTSESLVAALMWRFRGLCDVSSALSTLQDTRGSALSRERLAWAGCARGL
jgi:hypothetical protein